jgi:hypothetical protein
MLLRDREVFAQSVRAVHRYGTGDPNQLPSLDVENLFVLIIEKQFSDLHDSS